MIDELETQPSSHEAIRHPVLRLLVPEVPSGADGQGRACLLPDPSRSWGAALDQALRGSLDGETVLVLCDRGLRRAVMRLLVHHRWEWQRTPRVRRVVGRLRGAGLTVVGTYALWTSARLPRLAVPMQDQRTLRWIQRSGVLGDVGRFPLLRAAARSPALTPLAKRLSPAFAVVARQGVADANAA